MFDKDALDKLDRELQRWESETVARSLQKGPEKGAPFRTPSGIPTERVYTPLDVQDQDYVTDLGCPGEFPFTRGIQPTMFRSRLWSMRQYAGFGTAEESNQRFKYLLSRGQTGLSIAFDLPTQIGYDSDHPMAVAEVGTVGVAIDSLRDMEILLDGINLGDVSTSMTINAPAGVLLSMYAAVAEKQGVPRWKIDGTIQNDVLKEYVARGTYIFPPSPSVAIAADIIAFGSKEMPRWNTISLSGYHMREAGCTAVQEIAFTFANAIEYIEATLARGLRVDEFAPRLSWIFNTHNNLFEEVAKFRAARRLWARLMVDRFGAKDPRSCMLRFHTQTGGSTLTSQQSENNVIRAALQTLAAVLGGAQSIAVSCRDEALGLPTEESQNLSLRTQQIIGYETGVTETVDALGGSYFLESLTNTIEDGVKQYLSKIEELGGAAAAIQQGYIQREIEEKAFQFQRDVDEGRRVVVGVNRFHSSKDPVINAFRPDPRVSETQRSKLDALRRERDNRQVATSLKALEEAARKGSSLMPATYEAVRSYATLGEICDVMRQVYGEYK